MSYRRFQIIRKQNFEISCWPLIELETKIRHIRLQYLVFEVFWNPLPLTIQEIAHLCEVSIGTANNVKHRIQQGNPTHQKKERWGRKRVSTGHQESVLKQCLVYDVLKSVTKPETDWKNYDICTARNRLRTLRCKFVTPRKAPALTPPMTKQRLSFAQVQRHWTV